MSVAQVALGITALLNYVPIEVAAVHQAGSLVLLTLVTGLAHSLKFSKVGRAASVAAAATKKVVSA
jgi:cytochrome c oxidase assembly protein subunit 15